MYKISIIIPIYNVEKYLRECLDSVINQTLKDIEIILVDDGSPDNCPAICDEYAQKDKRIKVIHKKNGGYGSAVNTGINNSSGEYVAIVESDDWISEYMYELLYNEACKSQADIVKGSYCRVKNSKKYIMNVAYHIMQLYKKHKIFKLKDCPNILKYHTSIWSAIYKKSWLSENNINFVEDIRPYEDIPFIAQAYSKAQTISLVPIPLYFYREDVATSSMNSISKNVLNYIIQRARARKIYIDNNVFDHEFVENFYHITYAICQKFYKRVKKIYGNEYFYLMKDLFKNGENDGLKYINFKPKEIKDFKNICNLSYNQYCFTSILNRTKIFKEIFSIKNEQSGDIKHKIITILGIKIKFRVNKK